MRLRPALAADFGFIRSVAGRAEYAPFITDEDEAGLAVYLTSPAARLLIWEDDHGPRGFALYAVPQDGAGVVELRRLALDHAGRGEGQTFLRAMIGYAFHDLAAQRLWLDASGENLRAQAAYVRAGFVLEGRLRGHWYRPALGRVVDLLIYGMLRAEWQAG
ncbi:MAG: GNAT family N-acetyltransferase [Cypionkella sp.]|uniref:GNAT family N-acetyltransferase n=1 Tax=Cypionkella sp. TaxID=2811411 RepID=UPI002ABB5B50|nr:GNAT family N-acetyltransferase [Cypionkella sp.]MDZ4312681.1 GNAT family N-acetyltransferase [Cypionkella sp.]